MAMKISKHNWREVVAGAAIEAAEKVEEKLVGRRSRRTVTYNAAAGAVEYSSSEDDFDNNGGIENLADNLETVDFQKVLHGVVNGDESGNAEREIVSGSSPPPSVGHDSLDDPRIVKGVLHLGVRLPPSLGRDSQDEAGNAKNELLSGVCLPPSTGHDSQDETGKDKNELLSGVFLPPSLGYDSQVDVGNATGELSGVSFPPSLGHDPQSSASVRTVSKTETTVEEVEEVVELEFFHRSAVNKLHTHNAYCPKCNSHITKVVLRKVRRETTVTTFGSDDGHDLFGCSACFSVFVRIGKKLNPFPIFGWGDCGEGPISTDRVPLLSDTNRLPPGNENDRGKLVESQEGCFDLPWFSRNRRVQGGAPEQKEPAGLESQNPKTPLVTPTAKGPKQSGSIFDLGEEGGFIPGAIPPKKSDNTGDDIRIHIDDRGPSPTTRGSSSTQRPPIAVEVKDSRSVEIVKSIVYGGLIEAITSLSVVSSAAASDVGTTQIVTLGMANLIAGFFVICQNLMDLKYSAGGGPNLSDKADRYQELLGQKKHFLLHATFALFSYLVFGLIPPVIYGFTFRETDDKDYKIIAVAVASLLCIITLAAGKAYTQGANTVGKYFKTVLSYATAAGMASGVGYASGDLIKKFMDQLGWFDSKPAAPSVFLSNSQNPAWASY